uniref:Uncharacterized protein n=1 Tax=Caenorhabditis japonica TaxID=281687 RepID=A0A8R1EN30_CAEJA
VCDLECEISQEKDGHFSQTYANLWSPGHGKQDAEEKNKTKKEMFCSTQRSVT